MAKQRKQLVEAEPEEASLVEDALIRMSEAIERMADAVTELAEKEANPILEARGETSTLANPAAGFISRVRNVMRDRNYTVDEAAGFVRTQMHDEQRFALEHAALIGGYRAYTQTTRLIPPDLLYGTTVENPRAWVRMEGITVPRETAPVGAGTWQVGVEELPAAEQLSTQELGDIRRREP